MNKWSRGCAALLVAGSSVVAMAAGFQGLVTEAESGRVLAGARLTFRGADGISRQTQTDLQGRYSLNAPAGAYQLRVHHAGHIPYDSAPAFVLSPPTGKRTAHVQLRSPPITTVLLLRHADRAGSADQLSTAGEQRAQELLHVVQKAGLSAVFVSNTQRSQQTAQPLLTALNLTAEPAYPYQGGSAPTEVLDRIRNEFVGRTVLLLAHSDTLGAIVQALHGDPASCALQGEEFDNLCVVTLVGPWKTGVVNLQYGAQSPGP